jgi:hypothetical protein
MTDRTLLTVRQFAEKHPAFTQGSLRNLIFNAEPRITRKATIPGNGFGVCLVRMGRKILIDEEKFFAWLDGQNGKAA